MSGGSLLAFAAFAAVRAIGRALARPVVRAWVERVTGTVLVALGARLAVERRA